MTAHGASPSGCLLAAYRLLIDMATEKGKAMHLKRFKCHTLLLGAIVSLAFASQAWATAEVGSPAPDFCLPSSQDAEVCLKDFRGKDNVVLLFYILDFTSG
jgi:hypothetical protein